MLLVMEGCSRDLFVWARFFCSWKGKQHYKDAASCSSRFEISLNIFFLHLPAYIRYFQAKARRLGRHKLQLYTIYCSSECLWQWSSITMDAYCLGNVHCRNKNISWVLYAFIHTLDNYTRLDN
jgi:hypothetical protein